MEITSFSFGGTMRKAVGMRQSKRPWVTKLRPEMTAKIVDDPKGRGKMLVPTPLLVAEEIQKTKVGELVSRAYCGTCEK